MSEKAPAKPPKPPEHQEEAEDKDWVPPLILMAEHGDSFPIYIEAVYAIFRATFIDSQPKFQGRWVRCRRDPIYDSKEAGFWHCTSEGKTEEDRIPDIRRCERIRWLRAVIENHSDERVDVWYNDLRGGDIRYSLWFDEEYLVVLGDRRRYWQLITAFTTDQEHRKRKLRKERDESQEKAGNG